MTSVAAITAQMMGVAMDVRRFASDLLPLAIPMGTAAATTAPTMGVATDV
jgi:hypothetical protein